MGQEVLKQINNSDKFSVIAGVDITSIDTRCFPIYNNVSEIKEKPDVIIDFSVPKASLKILEYASKKHIPIVIATTGLSEEDMNIVKKEANNLPIFKSANMSYEINLMADIVSKLATQLQDSDIEIIETHHNKKIDSPSGTALILADKINDALGDKMNYEYNRHEKHEPRSKKEIGIHSIRGGTEVGKHTVIFFGENESLEITHNVTSRSIFAKGALKAAKFIVEQKNGLYDMKDLI
jgi:4-hydroxy-tetrahydrodipicolinate reductase